MAVQQMYPTVGDDFYHSDILHFIVPGVALAHLSVCRRIRHLDSIFSFDHLVIQQGREWFHCDIKRILDQTDVRCSPASAVIDTISLRVS